MSRGRKAARHSESHEDQLVGCGHRGRRRDGEDDERRVMVAVEVDQGDDGQAHPCGPPETGQADQHASFHPFTSALRAGVARATDASGAGASTFGVII